MRAIGVSAAQRLSRVLGLALARWQEVRGRVSAFSQVSGMVFWLVTNQVTVRPGVALSCRRCACSGHEVRPGPRMGLVPDEGAVQEFAAASADPAFGDRVHAGCPDVAQDGPDAGV